MREYQKQKRLKKRIFSKLSIIVLAALFVLLARSTYNLYVKNIESSKNLARVNASLQDAEDRYQTLSKETQKLETTEGKEEEIRHKFQVSKEGEKVIVVIDDQNTQENSTTTPSLFNRLKYAILSLFNN